MFRWIRALPCRRQPRQRAARPRIEALEDRSLLSANSFFQTNLVSDVAGIATQTDPELVNPWGLAAGPSGPFWVADNGTGLSTLYNKSGQHLPPVVTIPPPPGSPAGTTAAPTGVIFDGTAAFTVTAGGHSGPALFLFATEDGTISAWAPAVNATRAILEVNNSKSGAVYKGLADGVNAGKTLLYAANFRAGRIDIFDTHFHKVTLSGAFHDASIPAGFAPFNVQNIGGKLYVTYAKQDAARHDDVAGAGNGFVDVYNTAGTLLSRLKFTHKELNSPWGLALAPASFGPFGGDLLIGNFGDGRITAYNLKTNLVAGQLDGVDGKPLSIGGLWGLHFGNNGAAGTGRTLYFAAGLDHEAHGLFGSLQATTLAVLGSNAQANHVLQTNLVSDLKFFAKVTDPHLTNPWGVSASPGGPLWVSDNNSGFSTLYDISGTTGVAVDPLVVRIPVPAGSTAHVASPTGQVANTGGGFDLVPGMASTTSFFLFATEEGAIAGWNPSVSSSAVIRVNHHAAGADYTGLAMGTLAGHGTVLYAANFGKGTIDVYDQNFQPVTLAAGAFSDPNLSPVNFVPYNVAIINGQVFVTYAPKKGENGGFIDIFTMAGKLVGRFATSGPLASPWGLAVAPRTFGAFAGDLLVGNEGSGEIIAYNLTTKKEVGPLTDGLGRPIVIGGLWELRFGSGGSGGNPGTLYFTAGIGEYSHGLLGALQTIDPLKTT
jgi:uncharacterized protein (TIGR03118 family)